MTRRRWIADDPRPESRRPHRRTRRPSDPRPARPSRPGIRHRDRFHRSRRAGLATSTNTGWSSIWVKNSLKSRQSKSLSSSPFSNSTAWNGRSRNAPNSESSKSFLCLPAEPMLTWLPLRQSDSNAGAKIAFQAAEQVAPVAPPEIAMPVKVQEAVKLPGSLRSCLTNPKSRKRCERLFQHIRALLISAGDWSRGWLDRR